MSNEVQRAEEHPDAFEGKSLSNEEGHIPRSRTEGIAEDTLRAATEYTEADYKRILRKTDMILMPIMWIAYGIQQADKTGLSTQATFGIREDTHLVGQQYAWLTTIFFIGYIVGEIPGNIIMQKTSIRISLGISMICWGGIVMSIAGAKNWEGLMVIRFLQGMFECIISPAFLLITALWYKKEEQANRAILWGTANSGFTIITSLAMYGIGKAAQKHPDRLAPWKGQAYWLGGLTFVIAAFMITCFGSPREVWWLSAEDKRIQAARVLANSTGSDRQKRSKWKWEQVWSSFKEPQAYLFFFVVIINAIPTGGTKSGETHARHSCLMLISSVICSTFGNLIYTGFGFTPLEALSKGIIPQSGFIVVWFLLAAIILRKYQNLRFAWIIMSALIAFAGMIGCGILQKRNGDLWSRWGCYLVTGTGSICGCLIWTLLPSNIAGRTRKSVISVLTFFGYCAGNSLGAQVTRWAPTYTPSIIILAVFYVLEVLCFLAWLIYYVTVNRKRRAAWRDEGLSDEQALKKAEFLAEQDITDIDNPYFIYTF